MEMELEKLLKIESDLVNIFRKRALLLSSGKSDKNGLIDICEQIQIEMDRLNLKSYSDSELSSLLGLLEEKDFYEILVVEDNFLPEIRLYYQIIKEQMSRLKRKSLKRNLLLSERVSYYKALYHFRIVESFFLLNDEHIFDIYTIDYIYSYYSLWYSTPGLDDLTNVKVNLSYWTKGKNLSIKEYESYERHLVIMFWEHFLIHLEDSPIENLNVDYIKALFLNYARLSLVYYNVEELENYFKKFQLPIEYQEYLEDLLTILSKKKPYLHLVKKD